MHSLAGRRHAQPLTDRRPAVRSTAGVQTATGEQSARAAVGPIREPVSAAENPLALSPTNSAAEAVGRRTLSTAFVRVGPDGQLTVERRDGRTLVLRNVVMRRKDYCGTQLIGDKPGAEYCGKYAEVAAARPGGGRAARRTRPGGPQSARPRQTQLAAAAGSTPIKVDVRFAERAPVGSIRARGEVVPPTGLEPVTPALRMRCSTN